MSGLLVAEVDRRGDQCVLVPSPRGDLGAILAAARSAIEDPRAVRLADGSILMPWKDLSALRADGALAFSPLAERQMANRSFATDGDLGLSLARSRQQAEVDELRPLVAGSAVLATLDDHQVRNVAMMTATRDGLCLFDEQGTGKTVSLLAAFDLLVDQGVADVLLIVAPKSMVGEWCSEIAKFTGGLYAATALQGSAGEKSRALGDRSEVYVCNYETVSSIPDGLRLLCERYRVVLAVDESFNIKNPDAIRTDSLRHLREWCVRAFVLCGTPAPNDPADVIAQVSLVDCGRAFSDVALPKDVADRAAVVRSRMDARVVFTRNLKNVVLPELPGRRFTDINVPLNAQQQELYDDLSGSLLEDLQEASEEQYRREYVNFLARRAALLRLCSDPIGVDTELTDTAAKTMALDALLHRLVVEEQEKVVLWSYYRATLERLASRYDPYGVARIDGSITDVDDRRRAITAFQNDPSVRLFVGNPAAAGAGVTLHAARFAVYESMSNQAAHYLQSLDRIHRRGQGRAVEYFTLLSPGTVEISEYDRLKRKAAAQADLLGDPEPDRISREAMIEELTRLYPRERDS